MFAIDTGRVLYKAGNTSPFRSGKCLTRVGTGWDTRLPDQDRRRAQPGAIALAGRGPRHVKMEKALLEKPHEASWRAIPALLVLGCFATLAFVATPPGSTSTVVSHAADAEPHQMKSSQKHYAFEDEVQRVGELSPQLRAVVTQLAQHGAKISDKQDHILTQAIETRMSGLLAIKADVDELSQVRDRLCGFLLFSRLTQKRVRLSTAIWNGSSSLVEVA